MTLSRNVKESIKTALAMTIAYAVSLQMGWDRPYWAGFAVAFCSLPTIGQSLNKANLRMAGTVLAAGVALVVLGLTAQSRWLFIALVSIWCGCCTYLMSGSRNPYFWHIAGFVFVIICIDGGPYPDSAFSIAMTRLQQTALGLAVYALVAVFIWPYSSKRQLDSTVRALIDKQAELLKSYSEQIYSEVESDNSTEVYGQIVALTNQYSDLLSAATVDTEEVKESKAAWQSLLQASTEFAGTLQQWREGFRDLQTLDVRRIIPDVDTFIAELEARFVAIQQMSEPGYEATDKRQMDLRIDKEAAHALSPFQRAAVTSAVDDLKQLDTVSLKIYQLCRAIIIGGDIAHLPDVDISANVRYSGPDIDRLVAAGQVMTALWLAFVAAIYVDGFPGQFGILATVPPVAMLLFNSPQLSTGVLYLPTAFGVLFGSVFYVLVMPHLSGFASLGAMIFVGTFYLCFRFSSPQQALGRLMGLAMFLSIISVSNEQSYDILSVTTTALIWGLLFFLINIVAQIPYSPRPERAISRLLRRYFRSARYLIAQPAGTKFRRLSAWRRSYHQYEIASLPNKLDIHVTQLDPALLGKASVQHISLMVNRIHALHYRIESLQAAREVPEAREIAEQIREGSLAWRKIALETLAGLSNNPAQNSDSSRTELDDIMRRVERQFQEMLNHVSLSSNEYLNTYRVLGAYRGVSQVLLDFIDEAAEVDWKTWQQERFG